MPWVIAHCTAYISYFNIFAIPNKYFCYWKINNKCCSHINLPVLPAGLQIMADQGFEHQLPILVLPKANQVQIPKIMRRWEFFTKIANDWNVCSWQLQLHINYMYCFLPIFRTFRGRRAMIERCFGILKNSYTSAGTRRYRSRKLTGPLICNLTAALYNRRKLIFNLIRMETGHEFMPWWQVI